MNLSKEERLRLAMLDLVASAKRFFEEHDCNVPSCQADLRNAINSAEEELKKDAAT